MTVKDMDTLRASVREAGGEFHIVKNTLIKRLLEEKKFELKDEHYLNTTAIGFAFEDPPALAKALADYEKESDFLKLKVGYLDNKLMTPDEIKALANVPPLPIIRAKLLSTIIAPATQLARTMAEPGRQIAAILKAYAEATSGSA
jgi:large subunit ribosomal protein L10